LSLWGNLKEFNLLEILEFISERKKTGQLTMRNKGEEASICFRQGSLAQINTPFAKAPLLSRLREAGLVSADRDESKEERRVSDSLQREILLSQGVVQRDALEQFLSEEAYRDLAELLSWKEADFVFESKREQVEALLDLKLEEALREAQVRLNRLEELKNSLPPELSALRLARLPSAEKRLTLHSKEWRLICCLGREETMDNLRRQFGQDSFTFFETLSELLKDRLLEEPPAPSRSLEEKGEEKTEPEPAPSFQGKYINFK
jgi:hypothetical protein